jgi:hypothetical protein
MTLDAINVENERIVDAEGTGYDGILEVCRFFPPTPSMTINAMTFGTHAKLSYLCANLQIKLNGGTRPKLAHQCTTL